ncbi:MAG: ornithine cyclodeaminase family protein [Proteobacteria bacterium]|nr:ornithine cyclodeaminase family protein [Pseudomonadota bacterium]MBI3496414.1 ornithine cyclodeaminase family protein [Pseudomonadota bacterium]
MTTPSSGDTGTLIFGQADVARLLDIGSCIRVVKASLIEQDKGRAIGPAVLGLHADAGSFHVKAGGLRLHRLYVAAKINANFPTNPDRFGLPTIQGMIGLFDGGNGRLLAVLDSIEITAKRTAAMTAVAAMHLALPDAEVVAIIGCGVQGRHQLRALKEVLPLELALVVDRDPKVAAAFADELAAELGIEIRVEATIARATRCADVCVTCTPARAALLGLADVRPGAFIAAVGADNPEKQELAPDLMAASTVVVDHLEQCMEGGDLRHAIQAGAMRAADVHGELAAIVAGRKPGRRRPGEIAIFDSTGTALQDVAAAACVFEAALASGQACRVDFAGSIGGPGC